MLEQNSGCRREEIHACGHLLACSPAHGAAAACGDLFACSTVQRYCQER